jgi:hypothetical protein
MATPRTGRRRGRPKGHVRLPDSPQRFESAVWLALTELGMGPYPAAYLTTFLITSSAPITTESIDDVLLTSATMLPWRVIGRADRLRRNVPLVIERADEQELAWLTHSSGLLVALIKFTADGNTDGMVVTLDLLKEAGWSETLLRVSGRIGASLRSNFPPAEGPLSRTAARLLRDLQKTDCPN